LLFGDLVGFTTLSGQLDPEDVVLVQNACFEPSARGSPPRRPGREHHGRRCHGPVRRAESGRSSCAWGSTPARLDEDPHCTLDRHATLPGRAAWWRAGALRLRDDDEASILLERSLGIACVSPASPL